MILIFVEPHHQRLRVVMGGLLSVAEVEAFARDEQAAVRAMGLGDGEFDLLVVTEGNIVQTQQVMDAFGAMMRDLPLKARRVATVRDGVLTRMQSRRISKLRSNAEVFDDVAAAEAWLAEDPGSPERHDGCEVGSFCCSVLPVPPVSASVARCGPDRAFVRVT